MKVIKENFESINEKFINEATTSRIFTALTDKEGVNCAIISACRSDLSFEENQEQMTKLKAEVRKLGLGYNELVSRWTNPMNPGEDAVVEDEYALFIRDINYGDALKLAVSFRQYTFIYKQGHFCEEICSRAYDTYEIGDVVQTFNIADNHILNIDLAKQIFSKTVSGPSSKPIKSNNPFTLTPIDESFELYERLNPKPSSFQRNYSYIRLL